MFSKKNNQKSPLILLLLIIGFSLIFGWGMARVIQASDLTQVPSLLSQNSGNSQGSQLGTTVFRKL
jgi:hypothetical protein